MDIRLRYSPEGGLAAWVLTVKSRIELVLVFLPYRKLFKMAKLQYFVDL